MSLFGNAVVKLTTFSYVKPGVPLAAAAVTGIASILENLVFDAMPSSEHTSTAQVTRYPIEDGSKSADHIILDPDSLTLSLIITNSPLTRSLDAVSPDRANEVFEKLLLAKNARVVLDVVTTWRKYSSMAITQISHTLDAKTRNMAALSVKLEQILTATSEVIQVPVPKPSQPRAQPKKEQGIVNTKPSAGTEVERSTTNDAVRSISPEVRDVQGQPPSENF